MGADRVKLDDGELVRTGDFDERDAIVATDFLATAGELLGR
jgi:hypothetical protein